MATEKESLWWGTVLENRINQPRGGGYELSPARDRGPQLAPLLWRVEVVERRVKWEIIPSRRAVTPVAKQSLQAVRKCPP